MADIEYDTEKLREAKKSIDGLIGNLNDSNNTLTDALNDLQAKWCTDAGRKFFEEHKDTWSQSVSKYVKKLEGVSQMLQDAIGQYDQISGEVQSLRV